MNCWMALNCETRELDSDRSAVSDLWNLEGSLTLPQYPSFLFSTLVSYRRYGAVLIVGSSMPKSEDWQLSQTRFTVSGLFSYPSEILVSPVSAQDVWQIFAFCAAVRVSSQSPFIMFLSAVLTAPTPVCSSPLCRWHLALNWISYYRLTDLLGIALQHIKAGAAEIQATFLHWCLWMD